MAFIADDVVSVGRTIGAHFSVVALVPSVAAVAWLTALILMGGLRGTMDPVSGQMALAASPIAIPAAVVSIALVVALISNPFQFSFTQLLEGYWGGHERFAVLAANRINTHREFIRRWQNVQLDAEKGLIESADISPEEAAGQSHDDLLKLARSELSGRGGDALVQFDQIVARAGRATRGLPSAARVMPTRLGNALRSFEDRAGRQYELDVVVVAPLLSLLGDNPRSRYVGDTRRSMDLAVRSVMMALLAIPPTVVLLIDDGAWILLTLVPYFVAYVSYLGAVSAAHAYGNAVTFQVTLDRFDLYRQLHVRLPPNSEKERDDNLALTGQLRGARLPVTYLHEKPASP